MDGVVLDALGALVVALRALGRALLGALGVVPGILFVGATSSSARRSTPWKSARRRRSTLFMVLHLLESALHLERSIVVALGEHGALGVFRGVVLLAPRSGVVFLERVVHLERSSKPFL